MADDQETERKVCAHPGCEESFAVHYWGSVKSHGKGWFHQKDGTSWCPEHVPDWVEEWRARRAAGIPAEPWRKG